jgi:hypothetical protein
MGPRDIVRKAVESDHPNIGVFFPPPRMPKDPDAEAFRTYLKSVRELTADEVTTEYAAEAFKLASAYKDKEIVVRRAFRLLQFELVSVAIFLVVSAVIAASQQST